MNPPPASVASNAGWLEIIRGASPVLLIAPHGGRAGAAARATLHPKVNDLETAEITRDLAHRLNATALINWGMDRNELDCNRLTQVAAREPWLLELIADEVAGIVDRHSRATILIIHGWNIIEPRVDLGLGLRERNGRLHPPRGAHVSASNEFIHGTAAEFAERLRAAAILPTFGLRYPGGGAQNLLQAFTTRHVASSSNALKRLARVAASGLIDALQLELSVAVRMTGAPRDKLIEAISISFGAPLRKPQSRPTIEVVRTVTPLAAKKPVAVAPVPPFRIGVEFYDLNARIGGMASFDFGTNAAGGRIMMLFERRRVALFTGEGGAIRQGNMVSLGPLILDANPTRGGLHFRGPAVVVDEGTAYLSVEGALAQGRLDPAMEVDAVLEFDPGTPGFGDRLAGLERAIEQTVRDHHSLMDLADAAPPHPSFGRLHGSVSFDGVTRRLDAIARVGVSFTGLGARKFIERRMIWACTREAGRYAAIELRAVDLEAEVAHRRAQVLNNGVWRDAAIATLDLTTVSPYMPPDRISASIMSMASPIMLDGTADTFMTLSRPGPDGTRIHTSLGFATYRVDGITGAGMYEYSRHAGVLSASDPAESDED
jgi:hypothetical protein